MGERVGGGGAEGRWMVAVENREERRRGEGLRGERIGRRKRAVRGGRGMGRAIDGSRGAQRLEEVGAAEGGESERGEERGRRRW